jgi:ABC-type glutathione transport system ATPase component
VSLARILLAAAARADLDEPTSGLDMVGAGDGAQSTAGIAQTILPHLPVHFHDLSVVERLADRIAIMQLGRIVETGFTKDVFCPPAHSYTREL